IGRKPVFFIVIFVTVVTAVASVLMSNFTAFLILRIINGSLMPSVFQLPYIILLEIVGPSYRTRLNGIANSSWTIGLCVLPLIAYVTRHWVTLGLATSSVTVLFFCYWKFLPESPRWLLSQERYGEASIILTRIAETNGKPQDPVELRMKVQKLGERIKKEKNLNAVSNTSTDLVRYSNLRKKFLIITFCWVADIMAYYGLQINVSNLGGNPFLNFFYLALVEVPGFIFSWFFMEWYGRRWCSVSSLIVTGLACLVPVILSPDIPYVAVVASLIGKFGASASFMAVYQQSSELYPTTIRSIGMGMSGTFAGLANIVVPYVVFLAIYGKYLPYLIIGMVCILAGISATFLPETLNEILPQTIYDAEKFGKDQKFFSCGGRKRSISEEEQSPKLLNGIKDTDST
ncbi:organic cation transporter 1-like, partial [Stegodyphus dumicola]|uniref:organic cation transporter 1-like n=1 Tax=Stegodyphus dumicola TaxID=202533 RepID=UPI0015AFD626